MKYIFYLLLLFGTFSFAQNKENTVVVTYAKKINGFEENLKKVEDPNVRSRLITTNRAIKDYTYELIFNDEYSYFNVVEELSNDVHKNSGSAASIGGLGGRHLIDRKAKERLKETELFGEGYIVATPLNKFEWELINEEKEILGYRVFKATTIEKIDDFRGKHEQKITVWYCPSLPYSYGPSYFCGLPGVVLGAESGNIVTEAIDIKTKKTKTFKLPRFKGERVTETQFINIFNEGMNKFDGN